MNERPDDHIPMTQEERDAIYRRIMSRMVHDPEPWRPSLFDRLLPWLTIVLYLAIASLPWWLR